MASRAKPGHRDARWARTLVVLVTKGIHARVCTTIRGSNGEFRPLKSVTVCLSCVCVISTSRGGDLSGPVEVGGSSQVESLPEFYSGALWGGEPCPCWQRG